MSERKENALRRDRRRRTATLLILLMAVLGVVAAGLAAVVRDLNGGLLFTAAVLAALLGWSMSKVETPTWLAGSLASILGIAISVGRVGRLGSRLTTALQTVASLPWQVFGWMLEGPRPQWVAAMLSWQELLQDAGALLGRTLEWLAMLVLGHSAFDPVATAVVWSLVVWAVAVWAGWKVQRHRPLQGIAPAGALLASMLYYVGAKPFSLLLLILTALPLVALALHDARERRWEAQAMQYSRDMRKELALKVALVALGLTLAAAVAPLVTAERIVELIQKHNAEQEQRSEPVGESLGLEAQPDSQTAVFGRVRMTGLPRRHLIGSGPELSRQVVMVIRTSEVRRELPEAPHGYYWRSITYDRYNSRGWSTSDTELTEYEAGELAIDADMPFHRAVRHEVEVIGDVGQMIYAAGQLVTVDQTYEVAWRSPADPFGATTEATTYQVRSLVPTVGEEQLRSSGTDYPEWVLTHYLWLPSRVPERVRTLARDLTATERTPYDRALALESYLRTYPYTLEMPPVPSDRDIADYFLFDLREGYCDYYATSMVVLARAAGLPARLAIGYASGTYDPQNARFIVTAAEAHAWPEIYFAGIGWVPFEPTAGRPALERPELGPIEWPESQGRASPDGPGRPRAAPAAGSSFPWGWIVLGTIGALVSIGGAWWAVDSLRLRLLRPAAAVRTLYERLQRTAARLGVPLHSGDTPREFVASFRERAATLSSREHWGHILSAGGPQVEELSRLYEQVHFAPHSPDGRDRRQAIRTWRQLRRRLWAALLQRRLWAAAERVQRALRRGSYRTTAR